MPASNAERQAKFRARRKAEAQPIVAKAKDYLAEPFDKEARFWAVENGVVTDITNEVEAGRDALAQACADTIKRFG